MNPWKVIFRVGVFLALVLLFWTGYAALFRPLLARRAELRDREAALDAEVRALETRLRTLQSDQLRLEDDPHFVEKIAREELGYAKPGETVFRFVDGDRLP